MIYRFREGTHLDFSLVISAGSDNGRGRFSRDSNTQLSYRAADESQQNAGLLKEKDLAVVHRQTTMLWIQSVLLLIKLSHFQE